MRYLHLSLHTYLQHLQHTKPQTTPLHNSTTMIKLLLFIILPFLLSSIAVTAQQQQITTANNTINDSTNVTAQQQQPTNNDDGIILFDKTITFDNQMQANVVIYDGEEPVDVIYNSLHPHGDFAARRQVFEEVKSLGIPYTKEYALLFSQNILLDDDDSFSSVFTCHDNGSEPIDTIYNFAKEHSIERFFPQLGSTLLPQLCELVKCNRLRPIIFSNEISSAEDGQPLGVLEILQDVEPVDAVDAFVQNISVDVGDDSTVFRNNILEVVCKTLECTRTTPVVFRMLVKDENNEKVLDSIDIYEGEEVIDAVDRFISKSNLGLDEVTLKNYMLQEACKDEYRVKCTKNVGVAENGDPIFNNTMQL